MYIRYLQSKILNNKKTLIMKKKYRILSFVILMIAGNLNAQSSINFDSENSEPIIYLIKYTGDTIKGYPNIKNKVFTTSLVEYTYISKDPFGEINSAFWYYNDKGENIFLSFEELKEFEKIEVLDSSVHYERLEFESFNAFREIIAKSGSLVLFSRLTTNGAYYNILDTSSKKILLKKSIYHSRDGKFYLKYDKKRFKKYLKPHFSNCPELLNLIQANLNLTNYEGEKFTTSIGGKLFKGIVNYQCQ
jgi:hypothetical protein